MSLYIRVDDFPFTKPEESYKHNMNSFALFDDVMQDYGQKYVLGVIPKHAKEEELAELASSSNITVAMHGVNHNERFLDEFADCLTSSDIQFLLRNNKSRFEKVINKQIVDYIPPHNVLNIKTINALYMFQFKNIYGGPGTSEYAISKVKELGMNFFYSKEPLEYGRSDELLQRGSVEHIKEKLNEGKDVWLTLHFTWETNIGFDNLKRYLEKLLT